MRYLSRRAVRILDTPGGRQLRAQLCDHPHSTHDDCADAAAGAVEAWEQVLPYGL
jgi:phage terminase large subunit-like protein